MTARSHSSEPGPAEPLGAPVSASDPEVGTERHPGGAFGPQTGAQGVDGEPETQSSPFREQIAEALMRWAERHNNPEYAPMRRPDTVTQNAYSRADTVLAVVQPELDQLAALRQVSRGYCPDCGRGDAAPTVEDWQRERDRAEQVEELLHIAHETSNTSEAARARAVQRAEQAEAALARVREACDRLRRASVLADGEPHTDRERGVIQAVNRIHAALDRPAHDGGPTVQEATADDRAHWTNKHAGEGP